MFKNRTTEVIAVCMIWVQTLMLAGIPLTAQAAGGSLSLPGSTGSGYNPLGGPPYPMNPDSYFADDYGNILMYVNIIGNVGKTGQMIVRENADFGTILTTCGGVYGNVNLKKVLVVRSRPDESGQQVYIVNLKPFIKKGDRSSFIAIKPNDTIIFPQKGFSLYDIARWVGMISPFVYLYDTVTPNN
jgi:hypothetical protein